MNRTLHFLQLARSVLTGMGQYYDEIQQKLKKKDHLRQRLHNLNLFKTWIEAWLHLFPLGIQRIVKKKLTPQLFHYLYMTEGGTAFATDLFRQIDMHVMRLQNCITQKQWKLEAKQDKKLIILNPEKEKFWYDFILMASISICIEPSHSTQLSNMFQVTIQFLNLKTDQNLQKIVQLVTCALKDVESLWHITSKDPQSQLDGLWHIKNVLFQGKQWSFNHSFQDLLELCTS